MKNQLITSILIAITTILTSQLTSAQVPIGPLTWQEGELHNETNPYLEPASLLKNSPKHDWVTHRVRSRMPGYPNKFVDFGFNEEGGGYLWSAVLTNFRGLPKHYEVGQPGYGKGMLGALRDRYHANKYNPEQAGRNDYQGVKTKVSQSAPNHLIVDQFNPALYVDRSASNNPPALHYDLPLRSAFDFSSRSYSTSQRFGVPSLNHLEYWVFARHPAGIENVERRPHNLVRDVSLALPGNQTPSPKDLSFVVYTLRGLRPDASFQFLHYRSGSQWVSENLNNLGKNEKWKCHFKLSTPVFRRMSGAKIEDSSGCRLDLPIVIVSNSIDVSKGTGQGLWINPNHGFNKRQVKTIDVDTEAVIRSEDRRMSLFFELTPLLTPVESGGQRYRFLSARSFLSGLLSPQRASQVNGGRNVREVVTGQSTILFGTPNQIYRGVLKDWGRPK